MIGLIPVAGYIAVQVPWVQTYIAKKATGILNQKIHGRASIDKIAIVFFNKAIINDISITGENGDTLAYIEKLSVSISSRELIRKKIDVTRVLIHEGVFNYIQENDTNSNLSTIFGLGKSDSKDSTSTMPSISISEVRLRNFRFNYRNIEKLDTLVGEGCMNYTDIGASEIYARINNIKIDDNGITCRIQNISCLEKCGLRLNELQGDFSLDAHTTKITSLTLKDDYSSVNAGYLSFGYESSKDLSDFVHKIILGADFHNSVLDFRTLSHFTPALKSSTLSLTVNGEVKGPISNMRAKNLTANSLSGETNINLSAIIKGLPDINRTNFDLNIKNLTTQSQDVASLIASFGGTEINKSISSISPGTQYSLKGYFRGSIKEMRAHGTINSKQAGGLDFNLVLNDKGKSNGMIIKGDIGTNDLDVGHIINNKSLGRATIRTSMSVALKGKQHGGTIVGIDTLRVNRLGFNGYDYSNITAHKVEYSQDSFNGIVFGHDPNLDFLFQGRYAKKENNTNIYNVVLGVANIDLAALHFDKKNDVSRGKFNVRANVANTPSKDIYGDIMIKNISYTTTDGTYNIGDINLKSSAEGENFKIDFDTPFLTADFSCTGSPMPYLDKIMDILIYQQFGNVFKKREKNETEIIAKKSHFDLVTHDMRNICKIFSPNLYIADSTTLTMNTFPNDSINIKVGSHRIGFGKNFIKNISMSLNNPDSILACRIAADQIAFGGIDIHNNRIDIESKDGIIAFDYLFSNDGDIKNSLEFSSDIFFSRDSSNKLLTNILLHESELFIQGSKWNFQPSEITLGTNYYKLKDFSLYNDTQSIAATGLLSEDPLDKMEANLNNLNLGLINSFMSNNMNIQGVFTGTVNLSDLFGTPALLMNLKGKDVSIFDNSIGNIDMMSKWDKANERFLLILNNKYQSNSPLNISGSFKPNGKVVRMTVALKEFSLGHIKPFMADIFDHTSGTISGDIEIYGTLDKLLLSSNNTRINDFSFTPSFTKVPYILNGPIEITDNSINFVNLDLKDRFNHKATINGNLSHNFFKNIYLDTKLNFKGLECLNTVEKDNSTFYGSAYGSGTISIAGPLEDLFLDAAITTNEKTAIHIPLSKSASATKKDLLSFVSNENIVVDPYEEHIRSTIGKVTKSKSKFELRAKANVTSDAELFIEINKQLGDIIKCRGGGNIDLNVNPSKGIMDIRGDYTLDDGSYKFVILGLAARDFIIKPGGNIAFNGDLMSTNLNIGATYRTKTSISTLIADTTSVGNRRTVDCGINMSGSLVNPRIKFSIDIPDLDPITKGRVESALSTDDKIQKQVMALLITGSFVQDEQSGIVNNSSILYSNASEVLSNQFNNILRQLGVPLDLGLNYQPGQKGNNLFDVSLSYQAFNNRVIINGNVGNSPNSSNWMGNFEAEVKLDKKGKMRINAFTRAADSYSNYLETSQRSGLGFTYQDEFDTFGELIRSIFLSRKKREELEVKRLLEAEQELIKEEQESAVKKLQINKPKEDDYMIYE